MQSGLNIINVVCIRSIKLRSQHSLGSPEFGGHPDASVVEFMTIRPGRNSTLCHQERST